jgi:hypothetical protein
MPSSSEYPVTSKLCATEKVSVTHLEDVSMRRSPWVAGEVDLMAEGE